MIPDREDFWLSGSSNSSDTTTSGRTPSPPASAPDAAVDQLQQLLCNRPDPNSAWLSYRRYTKSMEANGRKFDQRLVLEAMFRGSDLVYRSAPAVVANGDS